MSNIPLEPYSPESLGPNMIPLLMVLLGLGALIYIGILIYALYLRIFKKGKTK